jgi:hypothetical protein
MGLARLATCIGALSNVHIMLVRKLKGKKPFGRHSRRWKGNMEKAL